MTVKIPEPNILDKILALFGKERRVIMPMELYEKYGQYVYAVAGRESFWRVLFKGKDK